MNTETKTSAESISEAPTLTVQEQLEAALKRVEQLQVQVVPAATAAPEVVVYNTISEVSSLLPARRHPDFGDIPVVNEPGANTAPTHFYLSMVDLGCQTRTLRCSREIWEWSEQFRPDSDVHASWILSKNADGIIVTVTRKPHLRSDPFGSKFNSDPNDLVLMRIGNQYEPTNLPIRFTNHLQDAIAALNDAGNVKPGNRLGRFVVRQVYADDIQSLVSIGLLDNDGR